MVMITGNDGSEFCFLFFPIGCFKCRFKLKAIAKQSSLLKFVREKCCDEQEGENTCFKVDIYRFVRVTGSLIDQTSLIY